MSRAITAVFAAFFLFPLVIAGASAQLSLSVSASARIETPVTGVALSSLDFGTLPKGSTTTIAATASGASNLVFSGDESDNVSISLPASMTLSTTAGGGASLTVTLDRANLRAGANENVRNADLVDASAGSATVRLSSDNGGNGTSGDGLGQTYLWVGGSATPDAFQQQGTYSGTFTVVVDYSN